MHIRTALLIISLLLTSCNFKNQNTTELIWGSPSAPHAIDAYVDMQCPACADFFRTHFPLLDTDYIKQGKIKMIVHPLTRHPQSFSATLAVYCAREESKDKAMATVLFAHQDQHYLSIYPRYAKQLGLNAATFQTCMETQRYKDAIDNEMQRAEQADISSTPTLILDKHFVLPTGAEYSTFVKKMEEEMRKK